MRKELDLANLVPTDNLVGSKTGRNYELTSYMYGCIDPRSNAVLSNVSVTGNSMSIDVWTGCPLQCAYCHVQGVREDLDPSDWKMRTKPVRRTTHSIDTVLSELIKHPLFEKDKTVLSICTSSTEPFIGDEVIESTISIMEWFASRNMKNPFWIVTKVGVPEEIVDRLKKVSKTNKVVISVCWANNNSDIEPYRKDRFMNIEKFRDTKDVYFTWYLRPLVKEWSEDFTHLDDMFKLISGKYKDDIRSIVAGGLRWTEGIEYGLKEVRDFELPSNVSSASRHTKTLTADDFLYIKRLGEKYFGKDKPIYLHSSCMLSEIIKGNNIALTNYFKPVACCDSICTAEQRAICKIRANDNLNFEEMNKFFTQNGIDIEIRSMREKDGKFEIVSEPELATFAPAISQKVVTMISEFLDKSIVDK